MRVFNLMIGYPVLLWFSCVWVYCLIFCFICVLLFVVYIFVDGFSYVFDNSVVWVFVGIDDFVLVFVTWCFLVLSRLFHWLHCWFGLLIVLFIVWNCSGAWFCGFDLWAILCCCWLWRVRWVWISYLFRWSCWL